MAKYVWQSCWPGPWNALHGIVQEFSAQAGIVQQGHATQTDNVQKGHMYSV